VIHSRDYCSSWCPLVSCLSSTQNSSAAVKVAYTLGYSNDAGWPTKFGNGLANIHLLGHLTTQYQILISGTDLSSHLMNIITASFANLDIKQPSSLEGSVQPLIIIDEIPGIRYPPSWLSPPSSPSDND